MAEPTTPSRYKTGVLVDLSVVTDSVKSARALGSSWLESLLSSVEAWTSSAPVLGPYVMEDVVLGEGGYGRVVRGRDTTNGETVAIKELPAGNERRHSAVVREVAILRRLSDGGKAHPHIVGFRGYFERADKHYVVMEACMGGELFDKVTGGEAANMTEAAGSALFAQLVAGLQHAHACGVAHRDLKLENVLLTADGQLKIADFGLAHMHRAKIGAEGGYEPELLREFCGSKSYCPPEMLAAQPYDAFAADVWSLGVCLFALLAGFFPYEEASAARDWRFNKASKAQLKGLSNTRTIFGFYSRPCPFSAELVELLDGLLRIDPSRRLTLRKVAASPWLLPADGRPTPGPAPDSAPGADPSAGPVEPQPKRTLSQGPAVDMAELEIAHRGGGPQCQVSADGPWGDEGSPGDEGSSSGSSGPPALGPPVLARQRACSRVAGGA